MKIRRLRTSQIIGEMVDEFYGELKQLREQGEKVCWWLGFPMPLLLRPIGLPYFYAEGFSARVGGRHEEIPFQNAAADDGFPTETCSYARCHVGCASLMRQNAPAEVAPLAAAIPEPNCVVVMNPGCSTELNWADHIVRNARVPSYYINVPHNWSGTEAESEEMARYMVKQFKELITFLEDIQGRHYDWNKLAEIVSYMRTVGTLRKEAMEMCAAIPSPASFFDWAINLAAYTVLQARPGLDTYFEKVKAECADRIAQGVGWVDDEKCRLLWDGIIPWNYVGHLSEKFGNQGACLVAARYTHIAFMHTPEALDPAHPLEGLAYNVAGLHLNLNVDSLIDKVAELCRQYHIDGVVLGSTRTCRPFNAYQLQMAETLSWKLGIPAAIVESDMTDHNFYSASQVDTRLQALVETITAKKSAKRS